MKDRILNFLESEHISPAEFADKIGVQRSSMSHILNGRNQPSAAFIQKMLHAFPLVDSRWLLIGEGKMNINPGIGSDSIIKSIPVQHLFSDESSNNNQQRGNQTATQVHTDSNLPDQQALSNPEPKMEIEPGKEELAENQNFSANIAGINTSVDKEIEQILFFYKDKTFHIYKPS